MFENYVNCRQVILAGAMTQKELIQAKIYRLEELRKYQSYYGPNTPYPVIIEINELEADLQRLIQARRARAARVAKKKKKNVSAGQLWHMSQATFDLVVTIGFIGLVFLLGTIIFAAYVQTRPANVASASGAALEPPTPTQRPTFTPTSDPNAPASPSGILEVSDPNGPASPSSMVEVIENSNLPPSNQPPTAVATLVPTLTPSATPAATETPLPTETPVPPPTSPPPPRPPPPTAAPPTPLPPPSFPFEVAEQGNRAFQKTNYHAIIIYVAVVSEGNIPLGGYKVVGDQVPSGQHAESSLSDWNWSVVNCLDCDYIKQGNLKFEPGPFSDGAWNIYLTDQSGVPLSPVVSLTYAADPEQWVWDFVIFKRRSG